MNKSFFAFPLITLVFLAGCASSYQEPAAPSPSTTPPPAATGTEHKVETYSTGFSPNTLTIKNGDKVTFVNMDSGQHWPASDIHPSHCVYKGCNIFDARKGLSPSESYSITFDLAGTWKFHDHLNPGLVGTVIVQ